MKGIITLSSLGLLWIIFDTIKKFKERITAKYILLAVYISMILLILSTMLNIWMDATIEWGTWYFPFFEEVPLINSYLLCVLLQLMLIMSVGVLLNVVIEKEPDEAVKKKNKEKLEKSKKIVSISFAVFNILLLGIVMSIDELKLLTNPQTTLPTVPLFISAIITGTNFLIMVIYLAFNGVMYYKFKFVYEWPKSVIETSLWFTAMLSLQCVALVTNFSLKYFFINRPA